MKKFKILLFSIVSAGCLLNFGGSVHAEVIKPEVVDSVNQKEPSKEEQIARYKEHIAKRFKEVCDNLKKQYDSIKEKTGKDVELKGFPDFAMDLEKLKPLADKLNEAIKNFVNLSKNCPAEDFDQFVKDYMTKVGGEIKCCSKQEFERLFQNIPAGGQAEAQSHGNSSDAQSGVAAKSRRFYRGINDDAGVERFRNGEVYIGGYRRGEFYDSKSAAAYGHGIYISSHKSMAIQYCTKEKKYKSGNMQSLTGGVVEMAVDESRAKYIDFDQIELIKLAFLYYYPEFCDVYKLWNKGLDLYLFNSYPIEFYEKAYEKVFGCKLTDIAKHVGPNFDREKPFALRNLLLSRLPGNSAEFSQELDKLMSSTTKKAHCLKKEVAVFDDPGLLAKILGFDVLYAGEGSHIYLVVTPGVLTICREGVEVEKKSIKRLIDEFMAVREK